MDWQNTHLAAVRTALPQAAVEAHGSATEPQRMDGWSDLDLRLITDDRIPLAALTAGSGVWAYEDVRTPTTETCRMVLADGRRIDVSVSGTGRIIGLSPAPDNEIRFIAAMAVTKLGRGDRLIGGHLTLELLRSCLVVAMQLRDNDLGMTVHRHGSERDRYADQVMSLPTLPLTVTPRPNIVERTVGLYATWRSQLEPDYRPDWGTLTLLIDRGLQLQPDPGLG